MAASSFNPSSSARPRICRERSARPADLGDGFAQDLYVIRNGWVNPVFQPVERGLHQHHLTRHSHHVQDVEASLIYGASISRPVTTMSLSVTLRSRQIMYRRPRPNSSTTPK